MKSIRVKLCIIIIAIVAISLGALAGLNYWQAKKIVQEDIEYQLAKATDSQAESIKLWFDIRKAEIGAMARASVIVSSNQEEGIAYLAREWKNNSLYENILWADTSGTFYGADGTKNSIAERPYFKQAMQGKISISDPVMSRSTGKLVVIVAVPIFNGGKVVGMIGGAVTITDIENQILAVKVGKTGYAFLVREDGLLVIHPNKELANKVNILTDPDGSAEFKAIGEKMIKGETGIGRYTYKGDDKYVVYTLIPGTSWSIGINVAVKEMTEKLDALTITSLLTIIVVLLISIVVIFLIASRIAKPLQQLEHAAQRIASGDISNVAVNINSQDEIGRLAKTFEMMAENLRSLIRQIGQSASQMAASSEEMTASAEQSAQAATQVAVSIVTVAHGADKQLELVDSATKMVDEISVGIQQVSNNAAIVASSTKQTASAANTGEQSIEKAVNQMNVIEQKTNATANVIRELEGKSKKIGQIVETIASIAGQTNLLALNAAIEAARAGEQGRGFSVVADEVRKLAEQSQQAAKQIADLIGEVQHQTSNAVVFMDEGKKEVTTGTEVVSLAGASFREIIKMIRDISSQTNEIAGAIQRVTSGSQEIVQAVRAIDAESKNTAEQTQTVSAATEEQSASMEEIAAASQALSKMAEELQGSICKFKV